MNDNEAEKAIRNRLYEVLRNLGEKYVQCLDCKHEQGDVYLVCIGRVYSKCIHCGTLFYDSKLT